MENSEENHIEQIVQNRIDAGIKIDFGSIFSNGWEIFKQMFWQVMVGSIILGIPVWIVSTIITNIFPVPLDFNPEDLGIRPGDSNIDFMEVYKKIFTKVMEMQSSPLVQIRQLVISLITILVSAPLQAGFIRNCRESDIGRSSFGDMFNYYKNEYTGRIIGAGIITTLMGSITGFLFSFIPMAGPFINIFFTILFYLLFVFVVPLIIFNNASLKQAFSLSLKLSLNKFFPIMGFMLLCYLTSLSGFIVCCIGILLTMAYLPIGNYLLYKQSMGFPEDETEKPEEPQHWQQQPPSI